MNDSGVCTNGTAPSVSSINRILRNRAAERAAAEFARAAGYGLYSAVSAAAGGPAPPYPFPWATPLHHHHWSQSGPAGMTPPTVPHSLPPALPTPPAAASSPHGPHHPHGSSNDSISPQASPIHPLHHHHHHHQGLGSLPPGLAAFAAAAAAAAAAREGANSSATPHGSAADSVPGSVSPTGSHRARRSSHGMY